MAFFRGLLYAFAISSLFWGPVAAGIYLLVRAQ
jgi:hypothetical protein